MGTAIRHATQERVPCAWPTRETVEDVVRKARRAVSDARHATEDFAAGAGLEVRRHPLAAVGIATGAGLAGGALFGFAAGWFARGRE